MGRSRDQTTFLEEAAAEIHSCGFVAAALVLSWVEAEPEEQVAVVVAEVADAEAVTVVIGARTVVVFAVVVMLPAVEEKEVESWLANAASAIVVAVELVAAVAE